MSSTSWKYVEVEREGSPFNALSKAHFERFSPKLLGLGKIAARSPRRDVLAAIFDLEGFTSFCAQEDPQLFVAQYLEKFLDWLFTCIASQFKKESIDDKVLIWGSLPFFAKFTGDGVLFLWDTNLSIGERGIGNTLCCLFDVCTKYVSEFLPTISSQATMVPQRLRVGISCGEVCPIGGGHDFVGPCINKASRLQKLGGLPFAVSRKGIDPLTAFIPKEYCKMVVTKTKIRGIGESELVIVYHAHLNALNPEERNQFVIVKDYSKTESPSPKT